MLQLKQEKWEERIVHFLDHRITIKQSADWWESEKKKICFDCDLNSICAGIYEMKKYYNYVNVYPQKLTKYEKELIVDKIKKR